MKIFLFNGPPGSGKDTVANFMAEHSVPNCKVMKFAAPLKDAACAIYCNNDRQLFDNLDSPEMKNHAHDQFMGISCRQAQINISEAFLKVIHGPKVFGKILAQSIQQEVMSGVETFLISDSGFKPEAEVLIETFGAENIVLIQIQRDGCTYQGDSRSYIDLSDMGVRSFVVTNPSGDVETFYKRVEEIIHSRLEGK